MNSVIVNIVLYLLVLEEDEFNIMIFLFEMELACLDMYPKFFWKLFALRKEALSCDSDYLLFILSVPECTS